MHIYILYIHISIYTYKITLYIIKSMKCIGCNKRQKCSFLQTKERNVVAIKTISSLFVSPVGAEGIKCITGLQSTGRSAFGCKFDGKDERPQSETGSSFLPPTFLPNYNLKLILFCSQNKLSHPVIDAAILHL